MAIWWFTPRWAILVLWILRVCAGKPGIASPGRWAGWHFITTASLTQIRLIADLQGPADQPNRLNGQLYLGSTSHRKAQTSATTPATPIIDKSLHGELGFELWLVRAADQWQQGLLKLADNQLSWQQDSQIHSVGLRGGQLQYAFRQWLATGQL